MLKIMENEIAYLRYATKMRPVLDLCNSARNAIEHFPFLKIFHVHIPI